MKGVERIHAVPGELEVLRLVFANGHMRCSDTNSISVLPQSKIFGRLTDRAEHRLPVTPDMRTAPISTEPFGPWNHQAMLHSTPGFCSVIWSDHVAQKMIATPCNAHLPLGHAGEQTR